MKVKINGRSKDVRTVSYNEKLNQVCLIDQRLLPHKFAVVNTKNYIETAEAIKNMTVRGAPAIAATAAYGLAQGLCEFKGSDINKFRQHTEKVFQTLKNARPTAVDPVNAMNRVLWWMNAGETVEELKSLAVLGAKVFADKSVEECKAIGANGAKLIKDGMRILTHCNAGWLACVDIGTATAPMYEAHSKGVKFTVFCDETRPRLQGASLTAWELAQANIAHYIIADNAAGYFMNRGEIDMVIVGSDRVIARTGEVINKIGTYTKAVLAHRHKIPFYVAIPFSSIDWDAKSSKEITIEERDQEEVLGVWGVVKKTASKKRQFSDEYAYVRVANPSSPARNPG
ncbi:MAG TPA: S-methyl-5-thioribose-1-phosphate isomerase, partial [Verrucomicrobiota bacterium]|nr:S-methyl-5-thioribose-1-phosphate isomerase [Verrucomicrobiota bacterium]